MTRLLYAGTRTIAIIRGLIACFLGSKKIAAPAHKVITSAQGFIVSTSRSSDGGWESWDRFTRSPCSTLFHQRMNDSAGVLPCLDRLCQLLPLNPNLPAEVVAVVLRVAKC